MTEQIAITGSAFLGYGKRPGSAEQPDPDETADAAAESSWPNASSLTAPRFRPLLRPFSWAALDKSVLAGARLVARDPLWNGRHEASRSNKKSSLNFDADIHREICDNEIRLGAYEESPQSRAGGAWAPLDIAIAPIDGHESLLKGHVGGSVSVVVGTHRDGLIRPSLLSPLQITNSHDVSGYLSSSLHGDEYCNRFIVIACSHRFADFMHAEQLHRVLPKESNEDLPLSSRKEGTIAHWIEQALGRFSQVNRQLNSDEDNGDHLAWYSRIAARPTVATHSPSNASTWLSAMSVLRSARQRLRIFNGSPLGAVATCMVPKLGLDCYVGVVREATAMMAAGIVRSRGGFLVAVPVYREIYQVESKKKSSGARQRTETRARVPKGSRAILLDDMINTDKVFAAITSITPHPVLDGVSFGSDQSVTTHTAVFNGISSTTRFMSHRRHLRDDHFYSFMSDERTMSAELVMAQATRAVFERDEKRGFSSEWMRRAKKLDKAYIARVSPAKS